jgi:hypothetical protein
VANSLRRTLLVDRAAGLSTVPSDALRFDVGRCQFAAAKDQVGGDRPISMLARTAKPIEHWYFGKVVHDMAGMELAAPTLPIDYCHDPEEILGYLDQFNAGNDGLTVSGKLVSFQPDDRMAEICTKADAGVPYQASIAFDPNTYILEVVPEGMQVTVNGYGLQGPAVVIRQWTLVAVSVCPYGADSGTRASLSAAAAGDVPVQFVSSSKDPAAMSDQAKPATPDTKPTELAAPAVPAPATSPAPVDPRAEFKATLAKFTEKFGAANGAAWAAEGLSYEQALEKHAATLSTQLTSEQGKTKELETKLASVPRGETEPVSFSTNEKHPAGGGTPAAPGKFAHMGNVGKFAASVAEKLPKK